MPTHFCVAPNTPGLPASLAAALAENPANGHTAEPGGRRKRAIGEFRKFWKPGRTLQIAFVDDPDDAHRQAIVDAIVLWQPWVNLTFEFVASKRGDIKILTGYNDNYSLIGTDALTVGPSDATMVLGIKPHEPRFQSTVLHEFGHGLGAQHEHQHPDADIPWDLPKVYAHFEALGVAREEVDHNLLNKLDRSLLLATRYDRRSIMHYPVKQELTLGDWTLAQNTRISRKDKAFMRRAYPTA
ncbi:hypothetical protein PMM47T1_04934 [Pseudomonas sp. M47T1]|uniref:M12 family metallopeptidase n=1 Tax=unclassified Pseudomonas TaxID=196821 RepID=UPI000260854C|nr:M12 family metallopeptidase [Pseudomonas sp. M47T1]EIK97829.1 hypothetical protein PMM47T1_04934 [Pseudomonas sp. M47T1]